MNKDAVLKVYASELERNKNEANPHLQAYRGTRTYIHAALQETMGQDALKTLTEEQGKALWRVVEKIVADAGLKEEG